MHRVCQLSCQKSERIPLVAARSIALKGAAESAAAGGIFWCSAFVPAHKNSVVVLGTLKNRTVRNAVLYELIVNATPEKVLYHSVAVPVFLRQKQLFRLIFLRSRGRRYPMTDLACESLHGFHKGIFLDFDKIIKGGNTAKTSRPPIPFAVGNLQAVVFSGTVNIACHTP